MDQRFLGRAFASALVSCVLALVSEARQLAGTWDGVYEPPGIDGGDPVSLLIEPGEGEHVRGTLVLPEAALRFEGSFDAAQGTLRFDVDGAQVAAEAGGERLQAELHLEGERLAGLA